MLALNASPQNPESRVSILRHPTVKRVRRVVIFGAIYAPAVYFAPVPALIFILCGVMDVSRHRKISYELIERYFMGNGIGTWILSPINLLADLLSCRNVGIHKLEDMPAEHRNEIEICVREFIANRDLIKNHVARSLAQNKRCMLTFKWYNARQSPDLKIPAFERNYRYIKTIAVSVFNTRERTSWHFGPLRLTFRVLFNLEPIQSNEVYIEVDDTVHYWKDNPLFIFDDTRMHRSINDVDHVRSCLFMDIVRPNYFRAGFEFAVFIASMIAGSFKRVFYKNWSFIR
jgi:aspartyl/asparaginyl beta-hydroxylase (cupin superfamily)